MKTINYLFLLTFMFNICQANNDQFSEKTLLTKQINDIRETNKKQSQMYQTGTLKTDLQLRNIINNKASSIDDIFWSVVKLQESLLFNPISWKESYLWFRFGSYLYEIAYFSGGNRFEKSTKAYLESALSNKDKIEILDKLLDLINNHKNIITPETIQYLTTADNLKLKINYFIDSINKEKNCYEQNLSQENKEIESFNNHFQEINKETDFNKKKEFLIKKIEEANDEKCLVKLINLFYQQKDYKNTVKWILIYLLRTESLSNIYSKNPNHPSCKLLLFGLKDIDFQTIKEYFVKLDEDDYGLYKIYNEAFEYIIKFSKSITEEYTEKDKLQHKMCLYSMSSFLFALFILQINSDLVFGLELA